MPELSPNNNALLADRDAGGGIPWKIFLLSLVLLAIVAAGYVGLRVGYRPYIAKQLADVDASIKALTEAIPEKDQASLIRFYSQIVNLKGLLDNHVVASKIPAFLEKNTNTHVAYANITINALRRELTLEGTTDRYETLSEQLEAIRQSPDVVGYLLNESRTAEGKINFRITATLRPELLRS